MDGLPSDHFFFFFGKGGGWRGEVQTVFFILNPFKCHNIAHGLSILH